MPVVLEENLNPMEFSMDFLVNPSMIDKNRHMNNVWAAQWIQDISVAHAEFVGSVANLDELGYSWVIHTQYIEYKNQAFLGDEIVGTTWVVGYSKVVSSRKCSFVRKSDGKVVFCSETQWVLMDLKRGRPVMIPEKIKKLFQKSENFPESTAP